MRAKQAVTELIESGLYTLASNPYLTGDLRKIAEEHKFRIKSATIVRRKPPWAKTRLHLAGMSKKQLERVGAFIEAIIEGREAGEIGEKKPASRWIRLKFGERKPRVYVSKAQPLEDLRRRLARIKEALGKAPKEEAAKGGVV